MNSFKKFLIRILNVKPIIKNQTIYKYPQGYANRDGVFTNTSIHEIISGTNKIYSVDEIDFTEFNEDEDYTLKQYKRDFVKISSYLFGIDFTSKFINDNLDYMKYCFKNKIPEGNALYDSVVVKKNPEAMKYFHENFFTKDLDSLSSEFIEHFNILKKSELDLSIFAPGMGQSLGIVLNEIEEKFFTSTIIKEEV